VLKVLLILLISSIALAEDIKVAVIDTGLDLEDIRFKPYLCATGHQDLTGEGIKDYNGHGTHVVGSIIRNSGHLGFCLVIIKAFGWKYSSTVYDASFQSILNINPTFVNISGGGQKTSLPEKLVIFKMKKTTFVAAAGNENVDISIKKYFPASYPFRNVIAVGSLDQNGLKAETSNYGRLVDAWEIGVDVESTCTESINCKMSGTSMATSIHTGKLIKKYVETH
jgi:thermitase